LTVSCLVAGHPRPGTTLDVKHPYVLVAIHETSYCKATAVQRDRRREEIAAVRNAADLCSGSIKPHALRSCCCSTSAKGDRAGVRNRYRRDIHALCASHLADTVGDSERFADWFKA